MGETTGAVNAATEPQTPDEIRDSIEQTRDEMTQTVDAIQEKLSPAHMAEQVKEATVSKAREVAVSASEKLKEVTSHAAATSQTGLAPTAESDPKSGIRAKARNVVNWVKHNPVPASIAAMVIILFALRRLRSGDEYEDIAAG